MRIPIPVSLKGNVNELVYVPEGAEVVYWMPMSEAGELFQHSVEFRKIQTVERRYRMLRRVLPLLLKERKEKLGALGIGYLSILRDLEAAYRAAGRLRAYGAAPSYEEWIANVERLQNYEGSELRGGRSAQRVSVIAFVYCNNENSANVQQTVESLERAGLSQDDIVLIDRSSDSIRGQISLTDGRMNKAENAFAIWLHEGDEVASSLLPWVAAEAASNPEAGLIYFDHDSLNECGERIDPHFKPDWSQELLRSTNYIGRAFVLRVSELDRLFSDTMKSLPHIHILLLRVTQSLLGKQISHIPAVLLHERVNEEPVEANAIQQALRTSGLEAQVEQMDHGCYRVKYSVPDEAPKISILIPTKDAVGLLRQCIESLLEKSSYANYEILILDNRSSEIETKEYFETLGSISHVRVLAYDAPFNFSAINNFAARHATGDVLCLLNNDTEVITPEWMEVMVGHLVQSDVGVVGAKLFYPDGKVQHGGDVVGVGGVANHLHAFIDRDDPGYCNRAILAQDLSAVTAACLMTWRKLYMDLGGLDEENLPVAFNDVDYCLRVREAGYRVVWTPHAQLYHHESVSRGKDDTPEKKARAKREVAYMRKRWREKLVGDPFYNPNLSYQRADFSLSNAPLVSVPWRK